MNRPASTPTSSSPLRAIYDVPAPAKLNLFLHITGRRPDGYHLIQSVFMLIDWCDTLHFELRHDGQITRRDLQSAASPSGDGPDEPLPAQDLTLRAARALQKASGTTLGVDISLEKRIPAQAGMGGGSSDAASCLLALQRLWGIQLPHSELLAIALSLGADVPFFLSGGHAWVEGVGEIITPIRLPAADFLVVKPAAGLSTPAIFSSPTLKRDTETATIQGFAAYTEDSVFGFGQFGQFGRNDLQPVALNLCPPIGQSLDWLGGAGLQGRMTGSGSAVFAHLPQKAEIPAAPGAWKVRKCSNLEAHPLAGW